MRTAIKSMLASVTMATILAGTALLGGGVATAAPDQASPAEGYTAPITAQAWANNWRDLYLTASPVAGGGLATVHRDIYLQAGTYQFTTDFSNAGTVYIKGSRTIWLQAGNYAWDCYLDQKCGYYDQSCSVNVWTGPAWVSYSPIYLSADGNYTFGGSLQWMSP